MKNGQPEVVMYEGLVVSEPMAAARLVAQEFKFVTLGFDYPHHAAKALSTDTDAVVTILNPFDLNAPEISPDIVDFLEKVHELKVPVAYLSDHLDAEDQSRPENGDIVIPWESQLNVGLSLRPWLGNIASKARARF